MRVSLASNVAVDTIQILILAIVQGLTEFLPISSSAHLILIPHLLGYEDQGLAFDVAVHIGSLLAVIAYFRHELRLMIADTWHSFSPGAQQTANSRLTWLIILATLPIVICGLLFKTHVATELRSTQVIATTTIIFGLLLLWHDIRGKRQRDEYSLRWRDALLIGMFQVLAIIPGTSRSGITMTAGMLLGLTREAASRFSFLLAIPTILMSGGLVTFDLIIGDNPVEWLALLLGVFCSFLAAYLCITLFLKIIEKVSMLPFVIYRIVLGIALLALSL